jgi:HAE1 family hydrophobic/amphiphilic exporter-1
MSLANVSIKRPIFLTCVIILMLAIGFLSMKKLPVDLFPNVEFPIVVVSTTYPGAGPKEIETLISRVLEEELSGVSGMKSIRSVSRESLSQVIAEFNLEVDVKYAEQQIRDRVSSAKRKLPTDIKEPTIRRVSPSDQPIMVLTLNSNLPAAKLFDLAEEEIRPRLEQVNQVGLVEVLGGRRREIHVNLNREKLKDYDVSASLIAQRIAATGQNVPIGKFDKKQSEITLRTIGEFQSVQDIRSTIVNFLGNDVPVSLDKVGYVEDALVDETARTYNNGNQSLMIMVFKQSGANTIAVSKSIEKEVERLNTYLKTTSGGGEIKVVRKNAEIIQFNVDDVQESILIGIILTVLVVFFFLGSGRSTIITGLALPNSLMGAFIIMAYAGFTINVMTLLALSLAVGLLVDDAIVVRENIFRHRAMGKSSIRAAIDGTNEVTLAVVATTLTVIAVFGPIAFLSGVVGQFFREFGLTICFAMLVSLFDALTIAPMMSAYFGGSHGIASTGIYGHTVGALLRGFDKFQQGLEWIYEKVLHVTMRVPILVILGGIAVFVLSIASTKYLPKTFLSPQDNGEFAVAVDLPPGTSLERMDEVARAIDNQIRSNAGVNLSLLTVGSREGAPNVAEFYVKLVPRKERTMNTSEFKEMLRTQLKKDFQFANPVVKDFDMMGGGMRAFNVNITGTDLNQIEKYAQALMVKLKDHPALKDVDITHRPGKPEVQFVIDRNKAERLGVQPNLAGNELRTLVEGATPAVFRQNGLEYDIRVRLQPNQRDIADAYRSTYVPNINGRLIKLDSVAKKEETTGPATINRQDRGRYIQIGADIAPDGPGMGAVMDDIKKFFETEQKLPEGMRYVFVGQAESFKELIDSMVLALILSVLFIFLVLASLYESFVTPLTIMLVLPLAVSGAIFGLLVTGKALDLNSMIGCILLLGIATKNSILLVDYANQEVQKGVSRRDAMIAAGKTRLRPILMTSVALIAGMLPIAIGLNEASKQRTTMGVAVIGGLISSTLLSLLIVPAAYIYIDAFRVYAKKVLGKLFLSKDEPADH